LEIGTRRLTDYIKKKINSFIWENVKLLDENTNLFTVMADGTETKTDYFASIKVFDADQKDCLKENHPYQQKLIKVLTAKMNDIHKNEFDYRLFK
tara:strand:- start:189 stop:473 length:285 start_codon:yes stop_codon:yes gene_type:complete